MPERPSWTPAPMSPDLVRPRPEAKWVVFYSFADGPEGGVYYDVHAIEQMRYQLTMLAYDMNGKPLPPDHGAPLRLRNETQLGFKQRRYLSPVLQPASSAHRLM